MAFVWRRGNTGFLRAAGSRGPLRRRAGGTLGIFRAIVPRLLRNRDALLRPRQRRSAIAARQAVGADACSGRNSSTRRRMFPARSWSAATRLKRAECRRISAMPCASTLGSTARAGLRASTSQAAVIGRRIKNGNGAKGAFGNSHSSGQAQGRPRARSPIAKTMVAFPGLRVHPHLNHGAPLPPRG